MITFEIEIFEMERRFNKDITIQNIYHHDESINFVK